MRKPSHEEFINAYNALPSAVSTYLAGENVGRAVAQLGQRYQLHVDVIGSLTDAVTYMLLGFLSPTDLMQEMAVLGIVNPKASLIAKELNDSVFKPLHEKMRSEAGKPARAPLTGVPAPLGTTPPPSPAPIAPASPPPPVTTRVATPPTPRPAPVIPPAVFEPRPPRIEREVTAPTSIAPLPAPVPKNYVRDPYREPIDEGTPQ